MVEYDYFLGLKHFSSFISIFLFQMGPIGQVLNRAVLLLLFFRIRIRLSESFPTGWVKVVEPTHKSNLSSLSITWQKGVPCGLR